MNLSDDISPTVRYRKKNGVFKIPYAVSDAMHTIVPYRAAKMLSFTISAKAFVIFPTACRGDNDVRLLSDLGDLSSLLLAFKVDDGNDGTLSSDN
mmetsp:Transcript_50909/g.59484  ORF Transcript_50909/g.59484 Transcript_50909/m.59484 type:complete len:95 (+) Transcript_50909:244-528(+)